MIKISSLLLVSILLAPGSCIFAQHAAIGQSMGPAKVAVGESMGPGYKPAVIGTSMAEGQKPQRIPGGVLIFNRTDSPVTFSIEFETISSVSGKVNSGEKIYFTPGRAFISGVVDSAGKFFPVRLYLRDGSEVKEAVKYLKNRPGELALGAVHYELTKENNQYVLREMQPGLPPLRPTAIGEKVPQLSGHDPALPVSSQPVSGNKKEDKPGLSRLDPATIRPQISIPYIKPVEK